MVCESHVSLLLLGVACATTWPALAPLPSCELSLPHMREGRAPIRERTRGFCTLIALRRNCSRGRRVRVDGRPDLLQDPRIQGGALLIDGASVAVDETCP
jgi:hypothetical protein